MIKKRKKQFKSSSKLTNSSFKCQACNSKCVIKIQSLESTPPPLRLDVFLLSRRRFVLACNIWVLSFVPSYNSGARGRENSKGSQYKWEKVPQISLTSKKIFLEKEQQIFGNFFVSFLWSLCVRVHSSDFFDFFFKIICLQNLWILFL